MPPQKRSIRDFFAPVQTTPQTGRPVTTKQPASKTSALPRTSSTPFTRQDNASGDPSLPPQSASREEISESDTIRVNTPQNKAPDSVPPPTSQSSSNVSGHTKRVVSNGEPVVLNSDSDSDSLSEFDFGEYDIKPKAAPIATRLKAEEARQSGGLDLPPKRQATDSFDRFLKTVQQNAESERKIAEHKASLDSPIVADAPSAELDISEEALADAVHDEEDPQKAKRLYLAMQRTNALHTECVFHLFDESHSSPAPTGPSFPMHCLPNHRWTSNFEDAQTRDHAFLSGFAASVFRVQQLPDELALWMIDQMTLGQKDYLHDNYIQLLNEQCSRLDVLLDKPRIDSMFTNVGVNPVCLNVLQEAAPSYEPHPAPVREVPPSLKCMCKLLQAVAPGLGAEASSHAFYVLHHVLMDHGVSSDVETLYTVQDTMETIMCHTIKLSSLLRDEVPLLLKRIRHPVLQKKLVANLPSKSPLAASYQRHLALSFLLYPRKLHVALDDPEISQMLKTCLSSQELRVTKDTHYISLAARLTLLDIAIGPGPSSVPYHPLTSPPTSQGGSSPVLAPGPQSSEDKAFNKEVDELAQLVKKLSSSILETSSLSDLTRLEAKDCSERLYYRLEHAVRIGGMKLLNPFGIDDDKASQARMMNRFFKLKERNHIKAEEDGDVKVEEASDVKMEDMSNVKTEEAS